MVQAIGSTRSPGQSSPTDAVGALQAQLALVENQLAACVHCDTAHTPEGKAKIQALAIRAQSLRNRMQDILNARQNPQASPGRPSPGATPDATQAGALVEGSLAQGGTAAGSAKVPTYSSGSRLDVTT